MSRHQHTFDRTYPMPFPVEKVYAHWVSSDTGVAPAGWESYIVGFTYHLHNHLQNHEHNPDRT